MKSLKQKIVRGIVTAGIGLASIVGGCEETLTEGDLFNAAMQGYGMRSGTVEGMQSAAVLGALGKTAADREYGLKRAREGRSEVNVYSGNLNGNKSQKGYTIVYRSIDNNETSRAKKNFKIFTCNYWKDFNNNGRADYPEEYVGIKNEFRKEEKLGLILQLPLSKISGKNLNLKVYDSKGSIICENSLKINYDNIRFYYGDGFNLMETLLEKGGLGFYKAVVYINDEFIGSHEFEIKE